LLALLGINVVPKARYACRATLQMVFTSCAMFCAILVFVIWTLYVWITAPKFGSQPECNSSTIYVIFGVSIHVIEPVLRWVIVALTASMALVLFVATLMTIPLRFCTQEQRSHQDGMYEGNEQRPTARARAGIQALITLCANIYFIVSLEQTISRNTIDVAEREWTFGQVIALFLLIGVAFDLLNLCLAVIERYRETVGRD
jgi:hypothetical protein